MNRFSDFDIKPRRDHFVGDKIKMMKILNQEIVIYDFKLAESKFDDSNGVMHLQLEFCGEKKVLFTASQVLRDQIKRVNDDRFPFVTTIVKEGESFCFT